MTDEVLYVTETEVLVVQEDGPTEVLEVADVPTDLIEVVQQGPIGPAGPATPGPKGDQGDQGEPGADALPYGPSLNVDASRPVAYVGYATRIMRLDYATYPPTKTTVATSNLATDWPNRASLGYA
jgi:hypothetical protein